MADGFHCSECGEFHDGLPLSWGPDVPAMWFGIPEGEGESRVDITSDQCVIDEKFFFLRGRIEIPVFNQSEPFAWLVWVSVSEANFLRASELWEQPGRENEPPYSGWLQSSLPCYENTLELATNVHTRRVGVRPYIELEPTDHPLAVEQRTGISLDRVREIAEICLHT